MSIKDNLLKIKPKIIHTGIFALILILVFIFSFQLGKLTSLRDARTPIALGSFETTAQATPQVKVDASITKTTPEKVASGGVVASKQGKTYHLPTCPGAKNIAPENKIIFASQDLAQKAGYSPAKNCKWDIK